MKIGCCGWGFFTPKKYFGDKWKDTFRNALQAYSKLFNCVEVNSTFYKIPSIKTVKRWYRDVRKIRDDFEFTVKVNRKITHELKFRNGCIDEFERIKEVARILRANVLVFQSPASFKPTEENLKRVKKFFNSIDREKFNIVWEVRWKKEWKRDIVRVLFSQINISQCVDPLRQKPFFIKNLLYLRLHGFGNPMYRYSFNKNELEKIINICNTYRDKRIYILFNNYNCYNNAITLSGMFKSLSYL